MRYRELGNTGLKVSEIGFGPERMKGTPEETREIAETLRQAGVNLLDCWMSDPRIRDNLGFAIEGRQDEWVVQGHIGACWKDGQYCRSRKRADIEEAFEDATPEERDYASVLAGAPAHAYFGQCTYCGHCQPCVEGLQAMRFLGGNMAHLLKALKLAEESGFEPPTQEQTTYTNFIR